MKVVSKTSTRKETEHYINFDLTIKDVISNIKSGFPSSFKSCQDSDFVTNSRTFVDSLVSLPEKLKHVLETIPSTCKYCKVHLDDWNHKENIQYQSNISYNFSGYKLMRTKIIFGQSDENTENVRG